MKTIEIERPDSPGTEHTVLGDHIIFVTMNYDEGPSNPLEDMDEMGEIVLFDRDGGYHDQYQVDEKMEELRAQWGSDLVPLSKYEHSGCIWFPMESHTPAGVEFDFDGTRFAGVWVPDPGLVGYAVSAGEAPGSPERKARMLGYAKEACDLFTNWAEGHVFGYEIAVYKVRRDDSSDPYDDLDDYRRNSPVYEDSCYGFYGDESFRSGLDEALHGLHHHLTSVES